ncbi:MBL fold metallo-hydrolase [Sphingomonas sp. UYP23]
MDRSGVRLTVVATPARHRLRGAEQKLGDVAGFVIRDASGRDLGYVTGDTFYYDGVADVAKRFHPAVVLVFAGVARTRRPFNLTMSNNGRARCGCGFSEGARVRRA